MHPPARRLEHHPPAAGRGRAAGAGAAHRHPRRSPRTPGTASSWYAEQAATLGPGDFVAAPDPAVVAPLTIRARSWIVAPAAPLVLTDPDDLRAAYLAPHEVMKRVTRR
ncbi:hypothetical protein [Streptomyces sp. G45]|uniref:hypothetical protein n=1 Tax=Streptomyces sp. G45 TaxID=3406627 RepID=UPI003C15B36E